jgi:hypothetical protein
MPREAGLYESAGGSVVEGYLLLKQSGANIPPAWIERARKSRTSAQPELAKALKERGPVGIIKLREWELRYQKECFYRGLRALLEVERNGRTKL